jgi:hypothetical protein
MGKVKAHVMEKGLEGLNPHEVILAKGNDLADAHALAAASMHPRPLESVQKKWAVVFNHALGVLKLAAAILPLWPMAGYEFNRPPRRAKEDVKLTDKVPAEQLHQWINGPGGWICRMCRSKCGDRKLPKRRARQRCPGLDDRLAAFATSPLGHRIVEVGHHLGDFSICADCGRWGTRSAKGLSRPCTGAPTTARTAQSWSEVFQRGGHPNPRVAAHSRSHADGFKVPEERTPFQKLRGTLCREMRRHRLRGKHKPWIAAASGYCPANGPLEVPVTAESGHLDLFEAVHEELLMGSLDEVNSLEQEELPDEEDVFGFAGLGFDDGGEAAAATTPADEQQEGQLERHDEIEEVRTPSASEVRSRGGCGLTGFHPRSAPLVAQAVSRMSSLTPCSSAAQGEAPFGRLQPVKPYGGCFTQASGIDGQKSTGVAWGGEGASSQVQQGSSSGNEAGCKRRADDEAAADGAVTTQFGLRAAVTEGATSESIRERLLREWRQRKSRRLAADLCAT